MGFRQNPLLPPRIGHDTLVLDTLGMDASAATAATADDNRRAGRRRKRKCKDDLARLREDAFDIVSRGVRIVLTVGVGTAIYFFIRFIGWLISSDWLKGGPF